MTSNKLITLLNSHFSALEKHIANTRGKGQLANTLIVSLSDGYQRAKVVTADLPSKSAGDDSTEVLKKHLAQRIEWAERKFENPVKWLRVEWVMKEREMTWQTFEQELTRYKRNYYRFGVAVKGVTKPWCLMTEMELNANACLYSGVRNPMAKLNRKNFDVYFKARHGSENMPDFADDMPLIAFQAAGMFFDADTGDVEKISTLVRFHGHRDMAALGVDNTADIIAKTTAYLANQVQAGGRFEYGHFPCFGRPINFYNTLRHASSIYATIEGYEFCRANGKNTDQLEQMAESIESALQYLLDNIIRHYDGDKAYVVEENGEIKLGANAVGILALVKYSQVFFYSPQCGEYLKVAEKLANGILAMQKDNGQFVHVLDAETLDVVAEERVIYYDGEAAFGLMRLYGVTKDPRWLACVEKAFDYFISAGHNGAHDHWLSYCSNELVMYKPEKKYFQFAVNNIKGYTHFIRHRITTFPTLLELSMAFHNMLLKLDEHPEHQDVLAGFDVKDFYESLHARANYLVNGFFFPEMAMYFKKPDSILHGCFIRHHAFRVRIDDVEHYLSGWVAYYALVASKKYPKTANQTGYSFDKNESILTGNTLPAATGGRWLTSPPSDWSATGLCIHPKSFEVGRLLVARSKNMTKGYLPAVAIKSFLLKGGGAVITDDAAQYADAGAPVLLVNDVRKAVLDIGRWARRHYRGSVVGVTGSAGKTTTVAMISHALKSVAGVSQTQGSANLPVGIAWNMAAMSQADDFWVLEMAIGNMALNSRLAQPDIAVITNIAAAHLEYHHDLETIATKKSRIFNAMPADGVAVICRDIAQYDIIADSAAEKGLQIITYGEHQDADIRLLDYHQGRADITVNGEKYAVKLTARGKHLMLNALTVLAIAVHKKLDIPAVIAKLESFEAIQGRGQASTLFYDENKLLTIYDEAYNANPLSMRAALATFDELDVAGDNKVIVLGDMLELGKDSEQYHLDLVDIIAKLSCREVLLVGKLVEPLIDALSARGIRARHYEDVQAAKSQLGEVVKSGDNILIKASNGIHLERLFK